MKSVEPFKRCALGSVLLASTSEGALLLVVCGLMIYCSTWAMAFLPGDVATVATSEVQNCGGVAVVHVVCLWLPIAVWFKEPPLWTAAWCRKRVGRVFENLRCTGRGGVLRNLVKKKWIRLYSCFLLIRYYPLLNSVYPEHTQDKCFWCTRLLPG